MTSRIDPPQVWDASPWEPTPSPPINRLLKSAWASPPFTPTTRDDLVAQGLVVPGLPPNKYDTWSHQP
jgi:hypothetical protein